MNLFRRSDIVVVPLTAPVAVLLGAPALGTLVGAAVWVLQRLIELALEHKAKATDNVRTAVGLNLGGVVGRAWLVALSILAVGTAGAREDGLAAAVLTFIAFTLYFANSLISRSLERTPDPS